MGDSNKARTLARARNRKRRLNRDWGRRATRGAASHGLGWHVENELIQSELVRQDHNVLAASRTLGYSPQKIRARLRAMSAESLPPEAMKARTFQRHTIGELVRSIERTHGPVVVGSMSSPPAAALGSSSKRPAGADDGEAWRPMWAGARE